MNFKDLNLPVDVLNRVASFKTQDGQQIKVKKYLPISDKNDLLTIALQKSEMGGLYNELLLDMYFHLNIIYLYTDIDFSAEDREDEFKLYDILEKNNIINQVVAILEENDEYTTLREMLEVMRDRHLNYENTAAAVLKRIISDLPANAAAAKEIVDSFNPDQYQAVVDFAIAANGGRNISTQQVVNDIQNKIDLSISPIVPQDHLPPKKKIVKIENAIKK